MATLKQILHRVAAHPAGAAPLLGALSACGFQPLALWPLTLLALAALVELIARARGWAHVLLIGWLFGVGHFCVGNNWIATAFTYQANMPAWLGGVAVFVLSLYLAVYPALAAVCAWLVSARLARPDPQRGAGGALPWLGLALAGFWIVTEWMRGWVFTGFAWNPIGIVLLPGFDGQGPAILTKWIGTYGLSGVVIGLAALLRRFAHGFAAGDARRRLAEIGWFLPLAGIVAAAMLLPADYLDRDKGAIPFTLVQPDIRQDVLGDPRHFESQFVKTARLTRPLKPGQRRVVFWPESGIPDYLRDGYPPYLYRQMTYAADPRVARERIARVIGPRSLLLTGAVDLVMEEGEPVAARNMITALGDRGNILAGYAKAHLVPFGEYLALRWLLEPLGASRLVAGTLDFWPGPGPRTYDFGRWGKIGMQICYEIVFSGEVVDPDHRPDYIFNPSNDGWFGSWGPPQHLAQARLRAIEEGLPVMRATTTGISAVIDANGIVRQHIPRFTAGRLDGLIPRPHPPTAFARAGNALPVSLGIALVLLSLVALRLRPR